MSTIEKRRFRRVPLVGSIEIEVGAVRIAAESRNISSNGMLVRSSQTFPENVQIRIWFTLPGAKSPMSVRGTILHVSPDAYMGVRFDEITESARLAIETYVNTSSEVS